MKVAVIGSRECKKLTIETVCSRIPSNTTEIVSGGAAGVDSLAEQAAAKLQLPLKLFLPDYSLLGRYAPLARDRQIVDYADLVLAFWDNRSRGTAYTLNYCIETGKKFFIYSLE